MCFLNIYKLTTYNAMINGYFYRDKKINTAKGNLTFASFQSESTMQNAIS